MEGGLRLVISMSMVVGAMISPVWSQQISSACTSSMITSFTPCLNYLTGSTNNGSSPTQECCRSLKNLMSNSVDCVCLLVTANVPFTIPFNRTLAISLPKACNMAGPPVECKASATPLPAPGPFSFGPAGPAPESDSSAPQTPSVVQPQDLAPPPSTEVFSPPPSATLDPPPLPPVSTPSLGSLIPSLNTNSAKKLPQISPIFILTLALGTFFY
ncbi:hypothetical protein AMTRI_Chr03g148720 [Amborella trichopoda]|uniref:Bifunctional inhibitor/plant lipid transfer protein/seed storage helical domain-containing protein n=2 Tax=Amborella trichopoda TaxID=13333 RepID=W1NVC1_AMBTC|nr:hypothetical protein AMTR_s00002p00272110 [Amborella trichopoda]